MIGYNKNEVIGKLRERATLQNLLITQSDSGFMTESWQNVNTYWASVNYRSGFEEEEADRVITEQSIIFTFRYSNSITENSRLIYRNNLYQVEKITLSNDRSFMYVTAFYRSGYILENVITCVAQLNNLVSLDANIKLTRNLISNLSANASLTANLFTPAITIVLVDSNLSATATFNGTVAKVINIDSTLNASATLSSANAIISKNLSSTLSASGNLSALLDVVTQGIVLVDASLNASANLSADIKRTANLVSSSSTSATTMLDATVTKVVQASMSATATTQSAAQITIVVNTAANATANISGDASLSYSVNAALDASAQATVNAQVSKVISAQMTATAQTTLEAAVGVTFVSSSVATATLVNADLLRSATLVSNLTATANLTTATITTIDNVEASLTATANLTTATITTAKNVSASVTGSATVTNANLNVGAIDPNFADVSLLLHGNGTNGSTTFIDNSPNAFTVTAVGNAQIDTTIKKYGTGSIELDGTGDYLTVPSNAVLGLGAGDYTIELWIYLTLDFNVNGKGVITADYSNNFAVIGANSGAGNRIDFYYAGAAFSTSTTFINLNTWTHIAICRLSGTTKIYFNGNQVGTSNLLTGTGVAKPVYIGTLSHDIPQTMSGYIDDVRITKGVARYTANFTPPSTQFPDQ